MTVLLVDGVYFTVQSRGREHLTSPDPVSQRGIEKAISTYLNRYKSGAPTGNQYRCMYVSPLGHRCGKIWCLQFFGARFSELKDGHIFQGFFFILFFFFFFNSLILAVSVSLGVKSISKPDI